MTGKKKTGLTIIIVIAAIAVAAAVLFDALGSAKTVEKSGVAMGSVVTVTLCGTADDTAAGEILQTVEEEDGRISRYREKSEIFRLNETGSLTVSDHTAAVLEKLLEIAEKSGGAFDISIGALSSLWDFDGENENVPETSAVRDALGLCGYEKIKHDENAYQLPKGLTLDLGAAGKGLACDDALTVLQGSEVKGAVVSVGGTILTYGKNGRSDDWTIGVRTPEKDDTSYFAKLTVRGTNFISTSGSYEKSFTKDGKLYHHILSPGTGFPAESGLKSVTVISDCGLVSDALSTACFVLGLQDSEILLEQYGAEAIFVDTENTVYVTDGIYDDFELVGDSYRVQRYE